jgi:hypothetical protein
LVASTPGIGSLAPVQEQEPHEPGRIITWSWATTAVFAAATLPVALGASSLEGVAIAISLAFFVVSLGIWAYAFAIAVARNAAGDDITVPSLFFLSGSAPARIRRHLFGSLTASVAIAVVTVKANPFSALVPMLALGLAALWAARHGTFPPRPAVTASRNRRP